MATRNSKKLALSVLGLGAATAAVVFGSWASWSAQTTNPGNTVTSGTLSISDKDGGGTSIDGSAVLTTSVSNIKPGDTHSDTVTIKNTSTFDLSAVKLSISGASGFAGGDTSNVLQIKIHDDTADRCITTDAAGACSFVTWDSGINLTNFSLKDNAGTTDVWTHDDPGTGPDEAEAHTFTITWNFVNGGGAANNASQGKTATFNMTWDAVL